MCSTPHVTIYLVLWARCFYDHFSNLKKVMSFFSLTQGSQNFVLFQLCIYEINRQTDTKRKKFTWRSSYFLAVLLTLIYMHMTSWGCLKGFMSYNPLILKNKTCPILNMCLFKMQVWIICRKSTNPEKAYIFLEKQINLEQSLKAINYFHLSKNKKHLFYFQFTQKKKDETKSVKKLEYGDCLK